MKLASCDRTVAAPVDVVWSLITTADGLNEWMSVDATVDLRRGGTITWTHQDGSVVAGEIREIVPLRRLEFTYGWEAGGFPVPVGSTVVTIELEPVGGATEVRVRHRGLSPEMTERHAEGWAHFIGRLVSRAEGAT